MQTYIKAGTATTPCDAAATPTAAVAANRFECIDRLVQGLSALFLSLRRRPVIRYQKGSNAAQRLAEGLYALTYKQQVGLFGSCCCCCLEALQYLQPLACQKICRQNQFLHSALLAWPVSQVVLLGADSSRPKG